MRTTTEFASLGELRRRDIDSNGLDREAALELRRRERAELRGAAGRHPAQLLAELARRRHGPAEHLTPTQRLAALYAHRYSPTRSNTRLLLLELHALRISQGW